MNKYLLLWIILTEGFVSIATEIITIRQLLPAVGSSIIVTSFIIGIFLLALAYGYKRGGRYQDNFKTILQRNFIIASALLGLGLSSSFILIFFYHVQNQLLITDLYTLLIYLTLITAPLVYLLGQTVPITMNMIDDEDRAGLVGSKVLHLSTLGSFLGSVLTTVLFMNYIGVAWTIIVNSALLLGLAILLSGKVLNRSLLATVLLIPAIYWLNVHTDPQATTNSNAYSNYHILDVFTIEEGKTGKVFAINNSASSFAEQDTLAGFKYIEIIKQIIWQQLKLQQQEILVLGAGGFSLSAAGNYGNHFTYVDIDPDLPKVVEGKFIPKINGDFVAADARTFLLNNANKYSLIVSDVVGSKISIPAHLITHQYFKLVAEHLNDDGLAIFNMLINPKLQDKYSQTVDNTIRSAFANCMTLPIDYGLEVSNVLYVCNNLPTSRSLAIYSDDLNRSTLDLATLR